MANPDADDRPLATVAADGRPGEAVPGESSATGTAPPDRPLNDAARRALAEAEARRAELDRRAAALAAVAEKDGRGGKEPVRYGDWEVKGLASDF